MSKTNSTRYLALDVFRGLTLALMIIVNTPGSDHAIYAQLEHAVWNGFTLTDLVFPSFLFVVGSAMSLTMQKFSSMSDREILRKVATRAALIFLCGYLLYWFPFFNADFQLSPIANTRILGVLQRIALCYFFATLIVHYWKDRGALAFSVFALLAYWLIMASFGDYTMQGNAGLRVDSAILGAAHMYHGEGIAFDPEGILGTLPSIVNVIAGYFAGRFVQSNGNRLSGLGCLVIVGLGCVIAALIWNEVFPINKKLWTSSFVLCTVGLDLIILAALVYVIDIVKFRRWTYFFEVFGKNTLFIYLLADILVVILARIHIGSKNLYSWIYTNVFQSWIEPYLASLLFAVCYVLVCWSVAFLMDKKKIYIKL
ncbi:MAG TPA: DUF5009 domain-containing protein [Burkholderiaceae bacterium]|jgi:predicted acyltransferase